MANVLSEIKYKLNSKLFKNDIPLLDENVIELNSVKELQKLFNWKNDPIIDDENVFKFEYPEDLNERRLKDAQAIATVMANVKPENALEIGTSTGHTTALMSINSPTSKIYTINIPPEKVLDGEGGVYTTFALEKEKIGQYYRERGCKNITQIYENSLTWKPTLKNVQVSFIDGCHDTDFVYNDTLKALQCMNEGFILWHDFNQSLRKKYPWINTVMHGVEKLYRHGHLRGKMYVIKDSWVGIYKIK